MPKRQRRCRDAEAVGTHLQQIGRVERLRSVQRVLAVKHQRQQAGGAYAGKQNSTGVVQHFHRQAEADRAAAEQQKTETSKCGRSPSGA